MEIVDRAPTDTGRTPPIGVRNAGLEPGTGGPAGKEGDPTVTKPTAIPDRAQVVIIGGGVMGVSAAFHLAEAGVRDVVLLERDSLGSGSTSKAAGGVRATFTDAVNIALGERSLRAFDEFGTRPGQEIDLHRPGYLFLVSTEQDVATFQAAVALQNEMGVPSRMIDVADAVRLSPLVRPDGLLAATFCPTDGHCTPESVVLGYASGARRLGARVLTHCAVTGISVTDGTVPGGTVAAVHTAGIPVTGGTVPGGTVTAVHTTAGTIATSTVICTAGAWSAQVGAMAGMDLPVQPLRRQILVTGEVPDLPPAMPMTIDFSTGFYFHTEGRGLLLGMADPRETPGFALDRTDAWLPLLTEAMAQRAPRILDMPIATGWAGLYEVTPDHNALIGEAGSPSRFLYATGFSGHGFLMGPAVGEVLRDLFLGRPPVVDVSGLTADRFAGDGLRPEAVIV
jgi:sarcosine oxidase subunit beta